MNREECGSMILDELISKGEERGYVKGDIYTNFDERIKIGDEITMNFGGVPVNFPKPWKLKNAENYFSTVDYGNRVRLIVEAKNGKIMTFDDARIYSPKKVIHRKNKEIGEGEERWDLFLNHVLRIWMVSLILVYLFKVNY